MIYQTAAHHFPSEHAQEMTALQSSRKRTG